MDMLKKSDAVKAALVKGLVRVVAADGTVWWVKPSPALTKFKT
jgi:hypothetical protein